MTDTVRTRAAILALLADNTSGDISPQDIRDMFVTVHGNYGGLYIQDGSTAQTGITTEAVKMTGWAGNLAASGVTPDYANNQVTVGSTGIYLVWVQLSFSGSLNTEFQAHLRVNGDEQVEGMHRKLGTGGDVGSASFIALKSLTADDVLTIYVESDAGGGASFTPTDAQFVVLRVA